MNVSHNARSPGRTTPTIAGVALLCLSAYAVAMPRSVPAAGVAASGTPPPLPALRGSFHEALAADAGGYDLDAKGCATLPEEKLTACFDASGAHFTGAAALGLHLTGYGRGETLQPVASAKPLIQANRVSYAHGNLTEWWRALPRGFEQGFTLAKRPDGRGELTLALTMSRQGAGASGRNTVAWGKLRYGELAVTDAKGRVVPATLKTQGKRILVSVHDRNATYPLTVDPLVWLEQKVSASDGAADDSFGWSVAVSGRAALVGAPFATVDGNDYQGAAYVFTESNGRWEQAAKLVASAGAADDEFGIWVALSGATAVIGAPFGSGNAGAAYVFHHSDGNWTQTATLTASDGASGDHFGWSVATDGITAVVGAPFATVRNHGDQGAAYVFSGSNGNWAQTAKLVSGDGAADDSFGWSVALDGGTALVGAYSADGYTGAAYVFGETGGAWTQLQRLAASDGTADDNFGWRVALDGTTALVGATGADDYTGAAYVFTKTAGTWSQSQKLGANDGAAGDDFGWAVALAGPTAVIGAAYGNAGTGAAYVFGRFNGTWLQTQRLIASDGEVFDAFGWSAAVDNATAVVGADGAIIGGKSFQGAAYFEGASALGLAVSAPQTVGHDENYVSQTIATNDASMASPAVSATIRVPAAASFVAATATQGSCSEHSGVVSCDFGVIGGNGGTATANVTLKATGSAGTTIENTASIAKATPALNASAPTVIGEAAACPRGYREYDGSLAAGRQAHSPIYRAPAGMENAILGAPPGFRLYAVFRSAGQGRKVYRIPGNEVHRRGPAGTYAWLVKAGDAGGAYTLCVRHP